MASDTHPIPESDYLDEGLEPHVLWVDPEAPSTGPDLQPQFYLNADERASTGPNGKISYSIDKAASTLVRDAPGWSRALGVGFNVTYAFRDSAPDQMPSDTSGFTRFNSQQITMTELALRAWADVANIVFTRVGSGTSGEGAYSNGAAMLFGNYSSGQEGASAFAYHPGSTSSWSAAGDVWINSTIGSNNNPILGNYGGQVLAHEIGHAIGLDHPSEYNAGKDVTITYLANATYYEDSRQYTVMSYFNEANTGGYFGGYSSAAPLLDDIAAAQLEYGPNNTTRTGDTVYGFNSNAERPWYATNSGFSKAVFAVWDAGGNDTLDFSGYSQNQRIDLREGFFSNVGGLTGNVAIAKNAKIENAKGGSGSDVIHGNGLNNSIFGGAGSDTISGGSGGSNYLRGEDGNDSIQGSLAFDDIHGNRGNDTARGGAGDDWVVGGQDHDTLYGDDGADIVHGSMGNDILDGGLDPDTVRGGQHDDVIYGRDGNDWLSGDRGSDTISGGTGADVFYSFVGAGLDRIADFNAAEGDRVQLEPGTPYSIAQVGADTVITLGSSADQVVLVGVNASSLAAGWIFIA